MVKKKDGFSDMWEFIEIPFYILFIWTILGYFLPLQSYVGNFWAWLINFGISAVLLGYIGYSAMLKKKPLGFGVKAGAIAGAFVGIIGAIIGIIFWHLYPAIYESAIEQAISQGAAEDISRDMMQIGVYASLIICPVVNAAMGALFSLLGIGTEKLLNPKK